MTPFFAQIKIYKNIMELFLYERIISNAYLYEQTAVNNSIVILPKLSLTSCPLSFNFYMKQEGEVERFLRRLPRYRFQRNGVFCEKQNEDSQKNDRMQH